METNSGTEQTLEKVQKKCDVCQRLFHASIRLKVSLPIYDDLKSREELSKDLIFLEGKAVLHLIDTAIRFSAAIFLIQMNSLLDSLLRVAGLHLFKSGMKLTLVSVIGLELTRFQHLHEADKFNYMN